MPIKDRDARNAAKRAYYAKNRAAIIRKALEYKKTERGAEAYRRAAQRYWQSDKGRAAAGRRRKSHRAQFTAHAWNLRRKYGITTELWHTMLQAQAGRCEVCRDPMREPCVDHRHEDGRVRDLLCGPCNWLVGAVERSPSLVDAAKEYLARHRA